MISTGVPQDRSANVDELRTEVLIQSLSSDKHQSRKVTWSIIKILKNSPRSSKIGAIRDSKSLANTLRTNFNQNKATTFS